MFDVATIQPFATQLPFHFPEVASSPHQPSSGRSVADDVGNTEFVLVVGVSTTAARLSARSAPPSHRSIGIIAS